MVQATTLKQADSEKIAIELRGLGVKYVAPPANGKIEIRLEDGRMFEFDENTLLDDVRQQIAMHEQ